MVSQGRVRLAAFDLDGTLTRGESVCETIGRRLGHLRRVRALEARCNERRDRDSILALRAELVAYYRGVTPARLRSSLSSLTIAPGARRGFELLRRAGVTTAIVSVTWAFAAEWLAERLGADYHVGTALRDDGTVEHFWPEDKAAWLARLMATLGVARHEAAAVGDSWLDAVMFAAVDHAFYVGVTPPPHPGLVHVPSGNIHTIARAITRLPHG